MAESESKPPAKKEKGAAYDSWKSTSPAPATGAQTPAKGTLKGRFTAMVDRFIRKFNTDKGWYDE